MEEDILQNFINLGESLIVLAVILILVGALGVVLGWVLLQWYRYKDREARALEYVILQVAVPRENEIKIDAMEQVFASLYATKKGGRLQFLKPQPHLTFEIVGRKEDIRFFVSVPEKLRDLVEKQIHGSYPGADVKVVDEYNIFTPDGKVAYASLKLRATDYNLIKVYKDLAVDPLSSITSVLAKMGEGEGAIVQVLISPADNNWRKAGKVVVGKSRAAETDEKSKGPGLDQRTMEAIENKCSRSGFHASVRMVVTSKDEETARMHLANLKAAFEQFSSDWNGFKGDKIWVKRNFMIDFIYRYQPMFRRPSILNTEELATIFHFPNKAIETPHIFWLNAKRAPAPAEVAASGLYLGKSIYRGITRPVYIGDDDRRRHLYIIGKTGVGKSWLMRDMILQDIRAGRGLCFIDPHDTFEEVLEMMPPERAEDVIYFDPSNTERPMGINVMEAYTEEQKHYVVSSIIGLFYKLYDPHQTGIVGPRLEHAIRNAMLTVMVEPGNTFIEVQRALTDSSFVQELLPKVTDPIVRRYWTDQIAQTADFHKSETLDYIVSKFGRFTTNKVIRNIIGQSKSAFDLRRVMDEGKILIVNLAKGAIGEENSNFLGLILVPRILVAAMSRQDTPIEKRRDFYLYVDEFQNFATPDFATILSEARKYRLNLTVANQFIGQMEENVKNAVFGNVGTLISFMVGVTDANFLQHYFAPTFSEQDLIHIEKNNVYVSTAVDDQPLPAFSVDLYQDPAEVKKRKNPRVAQMIKQLSSLKYAESREEVEKIITQRARL